MTTRAPIRSGGDPVVGFSHPRTIAQQVASRVMIHPRGLPEKLVLVEGACRTVTTATALTFAKSGVPTYNQYLKGIGRWLHHGATPELVEPWTIPNVPVVVLKESIGPYHATDCTFDPLAVLLASTENWLVAHGSLERSAAAKLAPMELARRLVIVRTARAPVPTWSSWKEKFVHNALPRVTIEGFIRAHETVARTIAEARRVGIRVLTYVADANRAPHTSMKALFASLSMPIDPVTTGWRGLPDYKVANQPPYYSDEMQKHAARKSEALQFAERDLANVTDAERQAMREAGLFDAYCSACETCENDLGLRLVEVSA